MQKSSASPEWPPVDESRRRIVEEMGLIWEEGGMPRMQGRVVGYLMLSTSPSVSSAELVAQLQASPASISTATRRLAEIGFIKRVPAFGSRGHHFMVEDDVWGAFLAGERRYLDRRVDFAERAMELLDTDSGPHRRFSYMRDYMEWLGKRHKKLLEEWEQYKAHRDQPHRDQPRPGA